jgi:hypothetical protein
MYIFFDDDEIVIHGDHDVDEPHRDEGIESLLDGCNKDIQFPDEPGQGGDAR